MRYLCFFVLSIWLTCSCQFPSAKTEAKILTRYEGPEPIKDTLRFDSTIGVIHVFVALCDNRFQGIVPVPAAIGNGKDPDRNLYWGCGYGVRTFFKNSAEWKLLKKSKPDSIRLERLIFKHRSKNYYLIADAYDGEYIERCTKDFLSGCAGQSKDTVHTDKKVIGAAGNAALLAYIGHDGLMDFRLSNSYENADGKTRDCIILACASKPYFTPYIRAAGANPIVWTTGLMCPEAYTLHDALSGYVAGEPAPAVRNRAAAAYSKYQKCSVKAARNLLVSAW